MLNYGELQILELMKNTLPSRLYPILFTVDNLRDAITTAKRVMIKEKIDRQKTGQSSTTPFMQVSDSNQSSVRTSKKGVTFDVMETIKRNSDSIDKLISLVSKMNMKWTKKRPHTDLRFTKVDLEAKVRIDNKIIYPTIDHSVGIGIEIEGITIIATTIGPIIGIDLGTTIGATIEEITTRLMIGETVTDKVTEGTIIDKTIAETITEIRERLRNYNCDNARDRSRDRQT